MIPKNKLTNPFNALRFIKLVESMIRNNPAKPMPTRKNTVGVVWNQ